MEAAAATHPGRARTNNEDLPLIDPARGIFGVIDGVGGQAGGEVAAAIARDVILQRLARPIGTPAERIREAIAIANNEIFRRAQGAVELRGMACVVTLAIVAEGRLVAGHVGDTRLYRIRADGIRKLTRDHSPVGEREDAGEIGEVDAMRHPRRNEVFRDVGSLYRDKDEEAFVDIIDEPAEPDSALLVCSDGLTDMIPSSAITHIVRQHAGDPAKVVEALVAAANDAGGKDNVTVVYAEGPQFASALRGDVADSLTPTEPLEKESRQNASAAVQRQAGESRRATGSVVASRTTWFVAGILLGIAGALGLMFYVAKTQAVASQTLVVAADGSAQFSSIGQALASARSGDVVRIEPGNYEEQVTLVDGVNLVARVPGSVTILRPRGMHGSVPALAAGSAVHARISGVRIVSAERLPSIGIGVGPGATVSLELVEIMGPLSPAIGLTPGSSVNVQGSRVNVSGIVIAVPDDAQASLANSILLRSARSPEPAISAGASSRLTLTGNVFAGFDPEIVTGLSAARRNEALTSNIVLPPAAAPQRRRDSR